MADFDMWGPAQSGDRLARQDMQDSQMNDLLFQQKTQALKDAQMKSQMLQQKQQQEQQEQAKIQDILQRNQAASGSELGMTMIKSGLLKQGEALLNVSSQAEQRLATIDKDGAETAAKKLDTQIKTTSFIADTLQDVNSQEEYQQALGRIESTIGKSLPDFYKTLQWNPQTKQMLTNMTTTIKDRLAEKRETQKIAYEKLQQDRQEKRDRLAQEKQDEVERYHETQRKRQQKIDGDKNFGPSKDAISSVSNLISQDYPGVAKDSSSFKFASEYVSGRAKQLIENNAGLTREQAINQAYSEAKQNGDISIEKGSSWNPFSSDKMTFTPKESAEARQTAKQKSEKQAPTQAIEYLKSHPELKEAFKKKYGYLPDDSSDEE